MKIRSLVLVFSLIFLATNASAGWLKSGALVGAGVLIGGASAPSQAEATKLSKMNTYVWDALKTFSLKKPNLELYIKELENSDVIYMIDTAAFGYALMGQREKAVSLYKNKIVPYIPLVDANKQSEYQHAYKVIQVCKPGMCMRMRSGQISLATQKPPTEQEKLQSLNKAIWHELKYGTPIKWDTLDKLAYSGNISMADTGAYGYAVKSYKKKALEIYEAEILPKLDGVSEAKRTKYLAAYDFLKTCDNQRCVRDRLKQ